MAVVLALASVATGARAQLPPPPPPNSTPQYEPPPPPAQTPGQAPPPRVAPRRERERPEPPQREPPQREPPRRAPAPVERAEPVERDDAPRARVGFQLALRTGLSFPMGSVGGNTVNGQTGDSLSNQFSAQVPLILDVGAKLTPSIFLGGYASFAFGGSGDAFRATECPGAARGCSGGEVRLGAEIQYNFQPAERLNWWLGYGAGFESASASSTGAGFNYSETFTGFELARLSGGVDYRASRHFGIGPFIDLALGEYTHAHYENANQQVLDTSPDPRSLHAWLTLGVRGVLFP